MDKYLSEIKSEDLIGRYMFPNEGQAEIFIEFISDKYYKIEDSNLVQLAFGKFDSFYDNFKHAITLKLENLGTAEIDFIFKFGFNLKFNDDCLKNGIQKKEYSFWDVKWESF